jgi:peptide/nickel transport system substrate-binding protein
VSKIVIASDSDISGLDPQKFKSDAGYAAVENLYDGLFDLETVARADGTGWATAQGLIGELIEAYELSEEGTVLTLHVRRDVRFSDGTPCRASSVKYTLERAIFGPGYLFPMMEMLTVTTKEQIRVLDEHSLELRLLHPNPLLWQLLPLNSFSVMSRDHAETHATADDPWASEWYSEGALGTGPYVLGSVTRGEEYVFERNPRHWRRDGMHNESVALRVVPSAAERLAALEQGQVDVAYGLEARDLLKCEDNDRLLVLSSPSTYCTVMSINNNVAPFDDVRVRKAVCYAIPYDDLRTEVMGAYCQPLVSPIPAGMPTHDGSMRMYDTDLNRARHLLADAGHADGFASRLIVREMRADEILAARVIQRALRPLGVSLDVVTVSDLEYHSRLKEFPLAMFGTFSWVNDPMYHLVANLKGGSGKNLANYDNLRVNELIERGMYELDGERRKAMSVEAQRIIMDEAPWALLYQPNFTVVTSSEIAGYAFYPDLIPRYRYLSREVSRADEDQTREE